MIVKYARHTIIMMADLTAKVFQYYLRISTLVFGSYEQEKNVIANIIMLSINETINLFSIHPSKA